ncbi:MAG: hypothetical protein AAF533_05430 [Acidobacteriota bacterium]
MPSHSPDRALHGLFLFLCLTAGSAQAGHQVGDLAPGNIDDSTEPPTHEVVGNGRIDIGDVVVLLRTAVGLNQLSHGESETEAELRARIEVLEMRVTELEAVETRIADLEDLLVHLRREGDDLFLEGANLHVRNGMGDTDVVNGLGNLTLGYNEQRGFLSDDRTGSHNLVLGRFNNFSSYSGVIAGESNALSAPLTSILGGRENLASAFGAMVVGGHGNESDGLETTILGGFGNLATGDRSSIAGGAGNDAIGETSAIAGGFGNTAEGASSTVGGGLINNALGEGSSVSGGESRTAPDESDWVAGTILEDN